MDKFYDIASFTQLSRAEFYLEILIGTIYSCQNNHAGLTNLGFAVHDFPYISYVILFVITYVILIHKGTYICDTYEVLRNAPTAPDLAYYYVCNMKLCFVTCQT